MSSNTALEEKTRHRALARQAMSRLLARDELDAFDEESRPARVVLAEDDREMRELLTSELEEAGYSVTAVADGRELLDLVAQEPDVTPDVVVSDIRMPRFTGLDVLAALRQSDWAMPVVLVTAFGDRETHEEAKRLGAAATLDKPFDIDELISVVRRFAPDA